MFMHISLSSSYPSFHPWLPQGEWTITRQQLQPAIDNLRPTTLDIYPEHTGNGSFSLDAAALQPSPCYRTPGERECCFWSYHGAQFWGIFRCFGLIEEAERSMTAPFRLAIRARPDAVPGPQIVDLIRDVLLEPVTASSVRISSSVGADAFLLAQGRSGILAVRTIWEEYTGRCLDPAFPDEQAADDLCSPFNVLWFSTECLILRHFQALNANIRREARLTVQTFMRPVDPGFPAATRRCAPSCTSEDDT